MVLNLKVKKSSHFGPLTKDKVESITKILMKLMLTKNELHLEEIPKFF